MTQSLNSSERWHIICGACVTFLQFTVVKCMLEGVAIQSIPEELTSLFQPDGTNFPLKIIKNRSVDKEFKYILAAEIDDLAFKPDDIFWRLQRDGTVAFTDLTSSIENLQTGINQWEFTSLSGPISTRLGTFSDKTRTHYLMQVYSRGYHKLLYTLIVTTDPNQPDPTTFQLKLHKDYHYPGFLFDVRLYVKANTESPGRLVRIIKDTGNGKYTVKIQGIDVYELNDQNAVFTKQDFFVEKKADSEEYIVVGSENKYLNPSPNSPHYLVDDGMILQGVFQCLCKGGIPTYRKMNPQLPENPRDLIFVNVFSENPPKLTTKIAGKLVKNDPKTSGYLHKFALVKTEKTSSSPCTILDEFITQKYLFTVSQEFETFKYTPFDQVDITHIEGSTYGVKSIAFNTAYEMHERGLLGELTFVNCDKPILVYGKSPNIICKIQGIAAKMAEEYYKPYSIFSLNFSDADPVTIKFQKFVPTYKKNGDVYFIQTQLEINYRQQHLRDNECLLSVYSGSSLKWRVVVEVTDVVPRVGELQLKAQNSPPENISENPGGFTFFLSKEGKVRVSSHDAGSTIFLVEKEGQPSTELQPNTQRRGMLRRTESSIGFINRRPKA